jgi:hypothetical protein
MIPQINKLRRPEDCEGYPFGFLQPLRIIDEKNPGPAGTPVDTV